MQRPKRALVVSPDPGLVQQVRGALADDTIDVLSATTSGAALLAIDAGCAVVLAALELPDGTGYDLCRELKAEDPDLVVLLTGEDRGGRALDLSHAAGADAFLHRPLAAAELVGRLRDLMDEEFFDRKPAPTRFSLSPPSPVSLVEPASGVFVDENTGYSVSVVDDGGGASAGERRPRTEELPMLNIEQFDPDNPVSIPVSADVTAHGLGVLDPDAPDLSVRRSARPAATTLHEPALDAAIDARIAQALLPGGALHAGLQDAVAEAVAKALRDVLPALLRGKGEGTA